MVKLNWLNPQLDVRLIFTNNFRIRNLFKLKDTFPDPLRSHIVYIYNCSGCTTAQYVGQPVTLHATM